MSPTVPVTVEYALTATGRTLTAPLAAIRQWAEMHIEHVLKSRARATPAGARQSRPDAPRDGRA